MFRTSPLEELEERLSRLRAAVDEKDWLRTRLREAAKQRARLEAELTAAREQLAREARDVERFEAGGLITQIYELLNLADGKLAKERRELAAATLRFEEARQALALLDQDTPAIKARLDELGDIDEAYGNALVEKKKWLDAGAIPGARAGVAEALERAERAGRVREWLRELDEAIYFGHRADATLRKMTEKLTGTVTEGLGAIERWWAAGLSVAAIRQDQESLLRLTTLARHQITLFHREMEDALDRIAESARTLPSMDLRQLLGAFDNLSLHWMERALKPVTVERIAGLRASIGTHLGQLQALRDELASPREAADAVLRDLDLIHGQ